MHRPRYDAKHQVLYFVDDANERGDVFAGRLNVFVCGAMQNPEKISDLLGREAPFAPAFVKGFRRAKAEVNGREVPFMIPADESEAISGVVWLDLTEESVQRIETLELRGDMRRRIDVKAHCGERTIDAISFIKKP